MKTIDCRNLACPQPVLDTKRALEGLKVGESLKIALNSISAKENVSRFLQTQGFEVKIAAKEGEFELETTKTSDLSVNSAEISCESSQNGVNFDKILFLKSDKVGSGELGEKLMVGFLTALRELKISKIVCVNEAVLIATNEQHKAFGALKGLESTGAEVINCGTCLEFFGKTNAVKVGRIGNAFEILTLLFDKNKVLSL